MARSKTSEAVIERLSAEDIAEAERRSVSITPGGRRLIDRKEMTPPVAQAPVRVEETELPSGRRLRTYQALEVA